MATYPIATIPSFTAGYGPQQGDFTTWWYDTASFLQNKIVLRVSQATTTTSLPSSGAVTTIGFDTVLEDPYNGWTAASHSWSPPAGYSGWFKVTLTIRMASAPAGLVDLRPCLKSNVRTSTWALACVQAADGPTSGVCGVWVAYLVGGQDSFTGAAQLENSASAVSTTNTAGQQSTMEIAWLSS